MPPRFLVEPSDVDVSHVVATKEDIRKVNPHRFEMEQIDVILRYDTEAGLCVALREVRDDEFWVRGHIPGRPVMPGILMCECAAQTASYYFTRASGFDGFLGFGGMDKVKFRGIVVPGDTLILVASCRGMRSRRAVFDCQGMVGDRLAFQCVIVGLAV
jgi:3-hydroxyacyl-[acyl-carrier-protein] dehydratase